MDKASNDNSTESFICLFADYYLIIGTYITYIPDYSKTITECFAGKG